MHCMMQSIAVFFTRVMNGENHSYVLRFLKTFGESVPRDANKNKMKMMQRSD